MKNKTTHCLLCRKLLRNRLPFAKYCKECSRKIKNTMSYRKWSAIEAIEHLKIKEVREW